MRVKLTPGFVARAPLPQPPKDREIHWDASQPGFGLMVTTAGQKRFVCQFRVGARSRRMHLKNGLTLGAAKKEAAKFLGDVARGKDPLAERQKAASAGADTFRAISEEYVRRESGNIRSMKQRQAILERLIFPKLGSRPIGEIRRSEIVRLLDQIEDASGGPMADLVLAIIRRIMSWHASRTDDFRSPIVRGMARTKQSEHARQRTLSDNELRAIWRAAEGSQGVFGPYVQFLLLTGARRTEAARMSRAEVASDTWVIPASRYKTGIEHVLPLSRSAMDVLDRLPQIGAGQFLFTTDGYRPFSGYSKSKAKFDRECGVVGWTLHDLRRTARSLMSRAGISADIAEICLGHVLPAMRRTYDRHSYFQEKRRAFEALAELVDRVLSPPADNIIAIGGT